MRRTLACLAAALTCQPVLAAEPVVLEPSSKWAVDFDKNKCRLVRFFGPEAARNVMILEQYLPADYFSLVFAGPAFDEIEWSIRGNMVRFLPDRPHTMQEPMIGPLDGYGRALFYRSVRLEGPEEAKTRADDAPKPPTKLDPALGAGVRFVDVADADNQLRLMTGPLESPIKVMNECLFDLIGSWGLDPEQHRTATRAAQPRDWDRTLKRLYARIPWERLNKSGGTDVMRIRLIIAADGAVESCTLLENTDPKLEKETCKGVAGAQIDPALDASGKPMRSFLPLDLFVTKSAPQTIRIPG